MLPSIVAIINLQFKKSMMLNQCKENEYKIVAFGYVWHI